MSKPFLVGKRVRWATITSEGSWDCEIIGSKRMGESMFYEVRLENGEEMFVASDDVHWFKILKKAEPATVEHIAKKRKHLRLV